MLMLGMARKDARCSTGWWVGPSSPRPIESWVITKIEPACSTQVQGEGDLEQIPDQLGKGSTYNGAQHGWPVLQGSRAQERRRPARAATLSQGPTLQMTPRCLTAGRRSGCAPVWPSREASAQQKAQQAFTCGCTAAPLA